MSKIDEAKEPSLPKEVPSRNLMPAGTVCFHIPYRTNSPKQISSEQYFKMLSRKSRYRMGYIQGDAICFIQRSSVVVIWKDELRKIEDFGGWKDE
jgi:hypothetical protein